MKKSLFLILFILLYISVHSQFSKTHYIPPLSGSSSIVPEGQYLYISTPSITPVNFKIIEIGGTTITKTVSKNTPYVHYVGNGIDTQLHVDAGITNTTFDNKGYIIEAEDLVYVSARVTAGSGNHAGELVSKGLASLGTRFRIGSFINTSVPINSDEITTFISVLATENNTTVNFSELKNGVTLINSSTGNAPFSVNLNTGESYVIAVRGDFNFANRDGLIGSLVTSDKPIALNCGSFAGSNGEMKNLDLGFDQIVSAERTGTDYIFIKSTGLDNVERILLVADQNNTDIFLNGSTTPSYNLNAGQYIALKGSDYSSQGNLYIKTSKNIFAYQSVGDDGLDPYTGQPFQGNQELFFVPPLSCQTPRIIDNIPLIDSVGGKKFEGRVTIVTLTDAILDFTINGINYPLNSLPDNVTVDGPTDVVGNPNYQTYTITGLTGNITVKSSGELYLAAYGSIGAATFGGFYSGFTFKPEVAFNKANISESNCIPNIKLEVSSLNPFDLYQWYYNDTLIPGATKSYYVPTVPGYYYVSATISSCGSPIVSDKIPVSSCPNDNDNDGINNNIDFDNDNDGITNCNESFGNQNFNLTNTTLGTIAIGNYTNPYTGTLTFNGTASSSPITGFADGNFVTESEQGKNNSVSYTVSNFTYPISLSVEYASTANSTDLLTSSTEVRLTCPNNKNLTIINPDNQILIDTNYDGIFESGVTEYSSFEIRFRLNGSIPLAAGTGTFAIKGDLIDFLTVTNINLTDDSKSRNGLRLVATCIPKNADNDTISDQYDSDSDNDGILDLTEIQGNNSISISHTDINKDGIDDAFGNGLSPIDSDSDGIPNYLDLDSDNDGIHDLDESGSNAPDADSNGMIDGNNFGNNGLANSLETSTDNGVLNFTLADTDTDGIYNAIELDSDNDLCNDTIEAGYTDSNSDGLLGGTTPPTVDSKGLVTSGTGYGNPNANYTNAAPITISTQPKDTTICELNTVLFTVASNAVSYQWEVSTDSGTTWNTITNNATYSGATTANLAISLVPANMNNYRYKVFLNRTGNTCGMYSSAAVLNILSMPPITTPVSLKQCDDDTDGVTIFNLTQKNDVISGNYRDQTITYYKTSAAAITQDNSLLISNPTAYTSGNKSVYARFENSNKCFAVAEIDLIVSVTQIPSNFQIPNLYKCDDYLDAVNDDRDGIAGFDFSNITNSLLTILPNNVSVNYYKTEADFLAETDASGKSLAIPNTSNYRNIGYPNQQSIWVRVDDNNDNSCYGYKTFDLVVEALPTANPVNSNNIIHQCDDNHDGKIGFDTSGIQSKVLNGQTNVTVTYFTSNGAQLSSPLPNPFTVNRTETITIKVANSTTQTGGQPCYDEETLQFIVDDLPQAFAIPNSLTTVCDDEENPADQDGKYPFDTSSFQSTLLGGQTGMVVYYFDKNNNPLSSPLPNPFVTDTQNVKAIVKNLANISCTAEVIIPFTVNPTPKIGLQDYDAICFPIGQTVINAGILDGTPISTYIYQWYQNNSIMPGKTSPTLTINTPSIYSVSVTNIHGCRKTRTITVKKSEIASIQDIEVEDLTDVNTILINVTGSGDYEYAMDDPKGPYQNSNSFSNVSIGLHAIYIQDKNGCGSVGPITVAVLGIPKYFTPNGDGFNDYWTIKGVTENYNSKSTLYIMDRFGKLLKQIQDLGKGWDGMYNGKEMPADDYWFTIKFEDGRSAKGHFALKR